MLVRRYARWYQLLVYLLLWHNYFAAVYLAILLFMVRRPAFTLAYLAGLWDALCNVFTGALPPLERVLRLCET